MGFYIACKEKNAWKKLFGEASLSCRSAYRKAHLKTRPDTSWLCSSTDGTPALTDSQKSLSASHIALWVIYRLFCSLNVRGMSSHNPGQSPGQGCARETGGSYQARLPQGGSHTSSVEVWTDPCHHNRSTAARHPHAILPASDPAITVKNAYKREELMRRYQRLRIQK